jgi:hypothetical protein
MYNVTIYINNEWLVLEAKKINHKYYRLENNEYITCEIIHRVDFISEN